MTSIERGGQTGKVLENALVKATVFPGLSGKVLDFTFKPAGERLFQPLEEELIEFATPPIVVNSNYAGYKDMIWEHKFNSAYRIYRGEVTASTPERVAVAMTWRGKDYRIRREVSLRKNRAALDVAVTVESLAKKDQTLSYWRQVTVDLKDRYRPGTQIVPLRPKPERELRGRSFHNRKDEFIFKEPAPTRSNNYLPTQPWWAWISPGSKLIMGEVVDDFESLLPDGFFYSFRRDLFLSQECVFGSRNFKPGEKRTYSLAFVVVDGLDDLDYLSRNLAVDVISAPSHIGNGEKPAAMSIRVASPRILKGCRLRAALIDDSGKTTVAETAVSADLSPTFAAQVILPLDMRTRPGVHQLGIQLVRDADVVETARIIRTKVSVGK